MQQPRSLGNKTCLLSNTYFASIHYFQLWVQVVGSSMTVLFA